MYYRNKAAASGSSPAAEKIVIRCFAVLMVIVVLVSTFPVAFADDLSGAAGSGATPRPASAEEVLTISGKGDDSVTLSPTSAGELQGLRIYGKTIQDGVPSLENPVDLVSPGDDGSITITISDGGSESQTIEIPLYEPLRGIPVDSGGNYVDENGQEWLCDYIDFDQGVIVRYYTFFNASSLTSWSHNSSSGNIHQFTSLVPSLDITSDSNSYSHTIMSNIGAGAHLEEGAWLYKNPTQKFVVVVLTSDIATTTSLVSWLKTHPVYFIYKTSNQKQIILSSSVLQSYSQSHSFNGSTVISASGCGIEATVFSSGTPASTPTPTPIPSPTPIPDSTPSPTQIPIETPAPEETPGPDDELGGEIKDSFLDSIFNITEEIDDFGNKDLPTLFGGDFKFFLSSARDIVINSDLWAFLTFWFLLELILSIYRRFKE